MRAKVSIPNLLFFLGFSEISGMSVNKCTTAEKLSGFDTFVRKNGSA